MQEIIQSYFRDHLDEYLKSLRHMVSINSFTANQDGVNELGRFTADRFAGLGFAADYIQSANPDFGKHLVLTRKGSSGRKIGLISHLDTVFPPEEEKANDFTWRVEGNRIYGPGTNDIKGGTLMILMIMEAIKKYYPDIFEDVSWIILVNAAEERWSHDFGDLCRKRLGRNAIAALVFEAGYFEGDQLTLVTARKGMAVYEIFVEGKSAHAGNGHPSGANALVQLAEIVKKISSLTDYKRDLTFNIGVIRGGTVPNRVPHFAQAKGEMRTFSQDIFTEGVKELLKLNHTPPLKSADGDFSCNIDIHVILENPPWPHNEGTDNLFSIWQKTARLFGMSITREERGGLSDGNQLWDFVPTIDGLGPNGRNAHCSEMSPDGSKEQEFVTRSSFVPKATINTLAIINLVKANHPTEY